MTKQELIALAFEGKAHIDIVFKHCVITRYRIVPTEFDEDGTPTDYPAIFVNIREGDSSVFDDESYFTDGISNFDLSEPDAGKIETAVERHAMKH